MPWWILVSENSGGEWSVGDAKRDYRICRYNHDRHLGTHLHHPLDGPAGAPVAIETAEYAKHILRRYAEHADHYEETALTEVIRQWKSK